MIKKAEEENEVDNVKVVFLLDKIKTDNEEAKDENAQKNEENQNSENMDDKTKGNQLVIISLLHFWQMFPQKKERILFRNENQRNNACIH